MQKKDHTPHVLLIGGGIMSATLGVLLKELIPHCHIVVVEKAATFATESSEAWNNAGTGHAAYCELNYTPSSSDGQIDISKALKIASQFEVSKSFWKYLIEKSALKNIETFITQIPHFSIVFGTEDVQFLKKRYDALCHHHLFEDLEFTTDINVLNNWLPLILKGRKTDEIIAATKMEYGTDINYGELTKALFAYLTQLADVDVYMNCEVRNLEKDDNQQWYVTAKDNINDDTISFTTPFVFIGAGGGSLPLLEKANIDEGEGYGGFPVSGQWLVCTNEAIIQQHHAKVYGKAALGAPPMSVPHLDTRMINGKKELLFGPFAGFSTKFLKNGSYFDLPSSIEFSNLFPMLSAGWHNIPLTKYLVNQVMQSHEDRMNALRQFYPDANNQDWELAIAGQRVQVIKKDDEDGGKLEFGTELICASDGSIAALLGASPGASTAVSVMLEIIKKCFPGELAKPEWQNKLKTMIPSFGTTLANEPELLRRIRTENNKVLFS
jgi:malate dehydrogenase (quinone)